MRDVVVVAVAWAAVTAGAAASVAAAPDVPVRVLFIGNSYTHANDLPGMVVALSAAGGRRIVTGMEAPGGCTLERHVRDGQGVSGHCMEYVMNTLSHLREMRIHDPALERLARRLGRQAASSSS